MRIGVDLLGMAHKLFPFERIVREIPTDAPIGFFWNEFGDARPRFIELINRGFRTFRPQMWWGGKAHVIAPMNVLQAELVELRDILHRFQNLDLKVYVSHSCEYAENDRNEVAKRVDLIKGLLPGVIPVNSVMTGATLPGVLTERHIVEKRPWPTADLISTDGTNIYDIDAAEFQKRYGNRKHPAFVWGYRFNLREIPDPGQAPPLIPNRKAAPDVRYTRAVLRLTEPPGEVGPIHTSLRNARKFEAPHIWKTHAEDDQEPNENMPDEVRENRPVLIIRPNVGAVDILATNGRVIGKLPRYKRGGDFPGGLTRYYSGLPGGIGLYGYEIGKKAKRESGSEYVFFRAGTRIFGPVHAAFRAGVMR